MFTIKTLTVKNFMSVGNSTQAVKFDKSFLTLVLGQNLDLGGDDTGARNGTGKTTIARALCNELACDYIIINGSDEGRQIDTLRTKIKQFASAVSFEGKTKVVILDLSLIHI